MLFYQERKHSNPILKEVIQFCLDYPEVQQRLGLSMKQLMDMERPYYIELRKQVTDYINEERRKENSRQEEQLAKREQERLAAELERAKHYNIAKQKTLKPQVRGR